MKLKCINNEDRCIYCNKFGLESEDMPFSTIIRCKFCGARFVILDEAKKNARK